MIKRNSNTSARPSTTPVREETCCPHNSLFKNAKIALPFQGRAKSPPQAEIGRGFFGGGLHDALQGEVIVDPIHEQAEIFAHTTYESFATDLREMLNRNITCVEMDPSYVSMEESLHSIEQSTHQSYPEDNRYIYHSDHLGSSSFLTDASGTPTQHLQYLPFGEPFIEQRSVTEYYTPYTFSAKERDLETGYSYFGARYYSSVLSIWLSVDPMADKYPSTGSFTYCANNPVKFIDQKGQEFEEIECGNNKWQNFLNIDNNGSFWKKIIETIFPNYNIQKGEQQQRKKSEPTYEQLIDSRLSSWKIGESMSGKELGDLMGMPEIHIAIKRITRADKSNFDITRTIAGKAILNDSPIKIEKTKLTINGKSESAYRIQIDYKKAGILGGALPDFYIHNNRVYYYKNNGKLVSYDIDEARNENK